MGTRSRVILKRNTKPDIYLWMHWDGYWEGQGGNLCESLRQLLETYTPQDLEAMLEALNVPNIGSDYQSFCGTRFADFLLGKTTYKNNNCDDIEYEYTIHMNCSVILGRHVLDENNHTYRLTFDQLKSHFRFEHITPTV